MVYDFGCAVTDGIHFMNPLHLVLRFKLFGHALLFGKLTNEQIEHILCVAVDLSEILLQFTADKEFIVKTALMVFQKCSMALLPHADREFFFCR